MPQCHIDVVRCLLDVGNSGGDYAMEAGHQGDLVLISNAGVGQETQAAAQCNLGFARKLGSPNKKIREKAISLLVLWLTSQKQVNEDALKKIWKGLFYCVWHSDKLPVQTDLIERLASLAEKLDTALSLLFFKVFLTTMRREWCGIDRLRLDKFYLLLRKYLVHMFVALENTGWDADFTKKFMDALLERAFLAKDQYAAVGINLHYADIFLQELEKFLPVRDETFKLLLVPFLVVVANTSDKSFLTRIRENIFDPLLDLGCNLITAKQEKNNLDPNVELFQSLAASLPIASEAFKLASMPSISQLNRRMLYELHEKFEKLEKQLNLSGITISFASVKKSKKVFIQNGSINQADKSKTKKNHVVKNKTKKNHAVKGAVPARDTAGKKSTAVSGGHIQASNILDTEGDTGRKPYSYIEAFNGDISTKGKVLGAKRKLRKRKGSGSQNKQNSQVNKQETHADTGIERKVAKQKSLKKGAEVAVVDKNRDISKEETSGIVRKTTNDVAEGCRLEFVDDANGLSINDAVVSNLRQQFDLLADESDTSHSPLSLISRASFSHNTGSKKRKRRNDTAVHAAGVVGSKKRKRRNDTAVHAVDVGENGVSTSCMNGSTSGKVKRVRFSLKNNLVWKPHRPLPPQNLRVPPSATPRGSALKKGVPPVPILSPEEISLNQRKGTPRRPLTQTNIRSMKILARGSKLLKNPIFSNA